jgi:hypothetical protein
VTVKVCPATRRIPGRELPVVLGATANWTAALAEPKFPAGTRIQGTWLTALQVQPVPTVTVTEPLAAALATDWLVTERAKEQPRVWMRRSAKETKLLRIEMLHGV